MHRWGDGFKYFEDVGKAAEEIGTFLRRYGRVHVTTTKEKFGTVRVYLQFGWSQVHSITHPGYVYSRYPKWLFKLDVYYLSKIITKLNWIVIPYQIWLYKLAYKKAINKYPHIKEEIIDGADYWEYVSNL